MMGFQDSNEVAQSSKTPGPHLVLTLFYILNVFLQVCEIFLSLFHPSNFRDLLIKHVRCIVKYKNITLSFSLIFTMTYEYINMINGKKSKYLPDSLSFENHEIALYTFHTTSQYYNTGVVIKYIDGWIADICYPYTWQAAITYVNVLLNIVMHPHANNNRVFKKNSNKKLMFYLHLISFQILPHILLTLEHQLLLYWLWKWLLLCY